MSKKHKNYNRELTVDDRFDLMFGSNETEDETSEKDWFHNKRDFAEQIAKSFGVSDPDDVEEPTSILKPSNIDDLNEETESNDTAEDVINMLGIKSNNDKKMAKSEEKTESRSTDTRKAKIVTRETSRVEQVAEDRAETPRIELWFNEKTHVLHFSDGIRCLDMPLDIMDSDEKVTTNGIPSEEDFEHLYEKLVASSVPVAVLSEVAFRMQYLYTYTFYKAMPFRFMYIDRGNHKIVYAYVLDPNYQYNLMTTYTSLKETNHLSSAYRLLSLFTDVDVIFSRRMFGKHDEDCVSSLRNELAIYGRCEEMLGNALKSDPVASSEPSENDMKHVDELNNFIFIHEDASNLLSHQVMGDSVLLNITVPETVLYNNDENSDDGDDEETETPSWREADDDEDESDSSDEDAEEEDIPTLAPKDEEERRSIMEAFGQPSDEEPDDDDEDDEEDSDDSDEEEEEEDIAKFLKDDDDKDDGDDFMIDVKR